METFFTVPGLRVDFWTRNLQITNKECYSFDGDALSLLLMADHSKFHTPSFQVPHTLLRILFQSSSNLREQVQLRRCSEGVTGRTFWASIPVGSERYSSSPQRPCWLWISPSPPFNTCWGKTAEPLSCLRWRKGGSPLCIDVKGAGLFKDTFFQKSSWAAQ